MPRGKQIKKEAITISKEDALKEFLKNCVAKNLRERSIETYKQYITPFLDWLETPLYSVNAETIENYTYYLCKLGTLKSATICSKIKNVRAFIYFCQSREYLQNNNFKITIPKQDETYKEPYTKAELRILTQQPNSENFIEWRTWALINFLIATGCRISTALNVKIENINFEEGYINFTHLKNRKVQTVPASNALIKVLQFYLSLWDWAEDDFLFSNYEAKKPIAVATAQQEIRHYNISRGVTKTSCHLFRHTFAKNYLMNGGGAFQLQRLMGHSDLQTTMRYVNLYNSDLKNNYEKFCPLDTI